MTEKWQAARSEYGSPALRSPRPLRGGRRFYGHAAHPAAQRFPSGERAELLTGESVAALSPVGEPGAGAVLRAAGELRRGLNVRLEGRGTRAGRGRRLAFAAILWCCTASHGFTPSLASRVCCSSFSWPQSRAWRRSQRPRELQRCRCCHWPSVTAATPFITRAVRAKADSSGKAPRVDLGPLPDSRGRVAGVRATGALRSGSCVTWLVDYRPSRSGRC